MTLPKVVIAFLAVTVLALFGQKAGFWAQPAPQRPLVAARTTAAPPAAVAVLPQVVAAPVQAAIAPIAVAAALPALPDGQESIDILPGGAGREETFLACTACHNTALIRRSGFSRDRWDDLMDWMVEKQAMNPLEPAMRATIVDYLATAFPPRQAPRGRNPFAAP